MHQNQSELAYIDNPPISKPWFDGMNYAGHTYEWLPSDTEENFQQLVQNPEHRQYFCNNGWAQPGTITYKINSHGFRSEEFDPAAASLISLGCSHTIGIGLPEEVTWPYLVAQTLELKNYNMGWGGIASDTCFRLAEYWIPRLRPCVVMMLPPDESRIEILTDKQFHRDQAHTIASSWGLEIFKNSDTFIKQWILNVENQRLNQLKNCLAIQQICNQHGILCVIPKDLDRAPEFRWDPEKDGYARDLLHPGPKRQKKIVEKMLNDWRQKIT